MSLNFDHAVDIRDVNRPHYAARNECPPHELVMLPGDGEREEVLPSGCWCVWLEQDGQAYYLTFSDDEFRARFVTGDDIPPALRAGVRMRESYDEWCDRMDGEARVLS